MQIDNQPVFGNTCGKIYRDRIVLATSNKESGFPFHEIKNLTFKQKFDPRGLLFACLPGAILAFPFVFKNEDTAIRIAAGVLGFLGVALCIFKAQKRYTLHMEMNSGKMIKVNVWHGNKKEAEKFVGKALPLILKAKKAPEAGYTINTAMAKALS